MLLKRTIERNTSIHSKYAQSLHLAFFNSRKRSPSAESVRSFKRIAERLDLDEFWVVAIHEIPHKRSFPVAKYVQLVGKSEHGTTWTSTASDFYEAATQRCLRYRAENDLPLEIKRGDGNFVIVMWYADQQ